MIHICSDPTSTAFANSSFVELSTLQKKSCKTSSLGSRDPKNSGLSTSFFFAYKTQNVCPLYVGKKYQSAKQIGLEN